MAVHMKIRVRRADTPCDSDQLPYSAQVTNPSHHTMNTSCGPAADNVQIDGFSPLRNPLCLTGVSSGMGLFQAAWT